MALEFHFLQFILLKWYRYQTRFHNYQGSLCEDGSPDMFKMVLLAQNWQLIPKVPGSILAGDLFHSPGKLQLICGLLLTLQQNDAFTKKVLYLFLIWHTAVLLLLHHNQRKSKFLFLDVKCTNITISEIENGAIGCGNFLFQLSPCRCVCVLNTCRKANYKMNFTVGIYSHGNIYSLKHF